MTHIKCDNCRAEVPSYEATHFGSTDMGYRDLCSRCCNQEIAELNDSDFKHVSFEPMTISDATNDKRTFHFVLRHIGDRVSLDAFEVAEGKRCGYQFQIIDELEADLFEVMRRLVERIRRTLATRYLVDEEWGTFIGGMEVSGQIDCDLDTNPSLPTIVIDGRDFSWNEFGRMMTSYEGWQFQLIFKDRSEELAPPIARPSER